MPTMPFAMLRAASTTLRSLGLGLAVIASGALSMIVAAPSALADTGDPSPTGYTADGSPDADAPVDPADNEPADNDPSALTDFRDTLDPHGTWVQDPTYGTIWVPNSAEVGSDFAPYQTAGHWAVADNGDWMWASDYDWGYVPFHYGRWVWAGSTWGWIPGRTYAPAWVTWRVGEDGYIGWAPLPPSWYWSNGIAVGLWSAPYAAYCFVPTTAVFYNHISTYVVRDRAVVQRAAAGTRTYRPATPSVGHRGGPSGAGGAGGPTARNKAPSPTFAAAGVPASSVPRTRTAPDARAMAFASRSSVGRAASVSRMPSAPSQQQARSSAWHNTYDGFGRSVRAPSGHTISQPPSGVHAASPSYRGGRAAPSFHAASPAYPSAPPSHHVAPSHHAAPSFHTSAPSHRAAPSFHTSAPSAHHAPSFSRPSTTVSKPVARPSGGGGRGGGGRRR